MYGARRGNRQLGGPSQDDENHFDPPISEYHKVEQGLTTIDDITRPSDLDCRALRVGDLAAFLQELNIAPESDN
jgi:hypothetical protein